MFRCLAGFVLGFLLALMGASTVAAADCQFVLGFNTLRDLIGHDIVGECLENEHYNEIGDSVQQTTGGLMAWRKADNWTAFTDGYRTWINGPNGLVMRLNTERFEWEADYAPGGGIATPTPEPITIRGSGSTGTARIEVPFRNAIVRLSHRVESSFGYHWLRVSVYGSTISDFRDNCKDSIELVQRYDRGSFLGDLPLWSCRSETVGEVVFDIDAPEEGEWEIEMRSFLESPRDAVAGFQGDGDKQYEVSGVFVSPGVKVWDFDHDGLGTFRVVAYCNGSYPETIISEEGKVAGSGVADLPIDRRCILFVKTDGPFKVAPRD